MTRHGILQGILQSKKSNQIKLFIFLSFCPNNIEKVCKLDNNTADI